MQSSLTSLLDLYGVFLIPVAVFVAGVVGYGVLYVSSRRGWLEWP
ncbi:hypothetical protein [Halomarina oriensis]|nr:hypothetical protein [Halomarina oriensis]